MAPLLIIRTWITIMILLFALRLSAGQYIAIDSIDAHSDYPRIKVLITLNGTDLSDADFNHEKYLSLYEDGQKIVDHITVRKQADNEKYLYLVLSIDSSKSISKKFLKNIKSSVGDIVKHLGSNDKIAAYRVNDHVMLLNDFTRNTDEIIRNISAVERHGQRTLLYNSIYDSIELLDGINLMNKKVIVFTDGKDEGSSVSDEDIIHFALNAEIPIYFICFKNSNDTQTMARISKLTGGKLIYGKDYKDVSGMYRTVLSVMKNRYIINYPSNMKPDRMNHQIEVRLKYGDIRDRDIENIKIDKKFLNCQLFPSNIIFCAGIGVLLFVSIIVIIIYFLNKQKGILREQFEIEKQMLLDAMMGSGETKALKYNEGQPYHILADPESRYAHAWLFQKDGPERGKKYPLQWRENTIGG